MFVWNDMAVPGFFMSFRLMKRELFIVKIWVFLCGRRVSYVRVRYRR